MKYIGFKAEPMTKTESAETCVAVINHTSTEKFVNSEKEIEVLLGCPKLFLFDLPYFSE